MVRAKKSLGQNFLTSTKIVDAIVCAANISENDTVLEIGPGKGVLTRALLNKAGKVIVVEKDDRLIELLQETFATEVEAGKLEIIHDDILEWDHAQLSCETYKLVANIPYYITGSVIQQFLTSEKQPESMTLMVQKEVADRIVTRDHKESLLSMSVKVYGTPHYIQKVPAQYFNPKPNVDSAILVIRDISKEFFHNISEDGFFKLIKGGFAHKRKLLSGNLTLLYPKEDVLRAFNSCGVTENSRAENLARESWKCLLQQLV